MRYPAFLAEVGLPENRSKLWFSVRSGLGIVIAFAAFAAFAMGSGVVPATPIVWVPILLKLCTNTLAWWSLRAKTSKIR